MTLFKLKWLRLFVRRHMQPIEIDKATFWKRRVSIMYALVAWNAFGFVLYLMFTGRADWARPYKSEEELKLTPAQQWTKTLRIKDATVYRVSGFQVSKYEIHNDFDEKNQLKEQKTTLNNEAQEIN